MPVQRITLFKVLDEANVQPILDAYQTVAETNQKVSLHPKISLNVSQPTDKPRVIRTANPTSSKSKPGNPSPATAAKATH